MRANDFGTKLQTADSSRCHAHNMNRRGPLNRRLLFLPCFVLAPAFSFSTPDLSQTYLDIAQRANQLKRWPDSKDFCEECLVLDQQTGTFSLPRFIDGNGPIGVFGFLHDNPSARSILKECDLAFEAFCGEICEDILQDDSKRQLMMEHWILQSPPTSHHITVAILQEHPSFLRDPEDLEKWRPLTDDCILSLSLRFQKRHRTLPLPILELDSLLFTPDGAMIAGFVDTCPSKRFDQLRASCREIAKQEMGDLMTTRPKNLIHATIGRVIGLPQSSRVSTPQDEALAELCQKYNDQILPATVEKIRNCQSTGCGSFALEEISLVRNTVWMLEEFIEYARWNISAS